MTVQGTLDQQEQLDSDVDIEGPQPSTKSYIHIDKLKSKLAYKIK